MRSFSRFVLLASSFLCVALIVSSIPIPRPNPFPNRIVEHTHHPATPHTPIAGVQHGHVTAHNVGSNGHVMGVMPVHPTMQHNMDDHKLQDHAHHISQQLGGTHVVHASHKEGDAHVHFHAVPRVQHTPHAMDKDHAIHDSHQPTHAPHSTLSLGEQGKVSVRADRANREGHVEHHYVDATATHGRGVAGTIKLHPEFHQGMSPEHLHAHAKWVNDRLAGSQKDNVKVHITHAFGEDHAHFIALPPAGHHIEPPRVPTPDNPPHQHIAPLSQAEKNAIHGHITTTNAQQHHFAGGSINPAHQAHVFHGTMPVHPGAPHTMTPAHLDEYAKAAHAGLVTQHGLNHDQAHDMVVAAVHKPGDNVVHFHTAPRGRNLFDAPRDGTFPKLNEVLNNANHHIPNQPTKIPWHHAELGALKDSLNSKGANANTFDEHINGHVIGVHGFNGTPQDPISQPCDNCHKALAQLPVEYRGRDRRLPAGMHRAL